MHSPDPRARLIELAAARAVSLTALSGLLGRNAAYLQQWVRRGTPRVLAERDRERLAAFFGVGEELLGGPAAPRAWRVPRLDVAASAGPGAAVDREVVLGSEVVAPELARTLGLTQGRAAVIAVRGDSMAPGLVDGDQLVVDETSRSPDARGGIYVVRVGGALLVKRVRGGRAGLSVTSDNPDAPPIGEGRIEVVGRVVWQMRAPR